jgi:hypothetical protein
MNRARQQSNPHFEEVMDRAKIAVVKTMFSTPANTPFHRRFVAAPWTIVLWPRGNDPFTETWD